MAEENENAKKGISVFNPVSGLLAIIRRLREALADWFAGNTAAALAVRTRLDEIAEAVEKIAALPERDRKLFEATLKQTEVILSSIEKIPELQSSEKVREVLGQIDPLMSLLKESFPVVQTLGGQKVHIADALASIGDIRDVRQATDGSVLFLGSERSVVMRAVDLPKEAEDGRSLTYMLTDIPENRIEKEKSDAKWTPWKEDDVWNLNNELTAPENPTKKTSIEEALRTLIGSRLQETMDSRFDSFAVTLVQERELSGKTGLPAAERSAKDGPFVAEGTADSLVLTKEGSPETLAMARREDGSVCMLYKSSAEDPGKIVFETVLARDGSGKPVCEARVDCESMDFAKEWLSHKYVSAFLVANGYDKDMISNRIQVSLDAGFVQRFPDVRSQDEAKVTAYAQNLAKAYHNFEVMECQNFQDDILGKNVFTTFVKMVNKSNEKDEYWIGFTENGEPVSVYTPDKKMGFLPASTVGKQGDFVRSILNVSNEPERRNERNTERRRPEPTRQTDRREQPENPAPEQTETR